MDAIGFVKKYGHLGEPKREPDFEGVSIPGYTHPHALIYPWKRDDPAFSQPSVDGRDAYREDFESIDVPKLPVKYMHELPLQEVPNSGEWVLVDVGSHLGRRNTRRIARRKPHLRVYMVDNLSREDVDNNNNYHAYPRNDIAGEELRVRIPVNDDVEGSVNNLLEVNGYTNITYIHRELAPDSLELGVEDVLRSRRVVFTGYNNPKGLGNITTSLAIKNRAEGLYLSNSAIEKIPQFSPHFDPLKSFLSGELSEREIKKVIQLIHDPMAGKGCSAGKYDYEDEGQRLFGSTLKLIFALAQKEMLERDGFNVEIFRRMEAYYNPPDHHLVAKK